MTKPQNLEIRDVTCVGFSQATSEGNAQPLQPHLLLITSTVHFTFDVDCRQTSLRCLENVGNSESVPHAFSEVNLRTLDKEVGP